MRVGVVGSGIAGLGAAYLLARAHEVEILEAADYAGGHSHTVPHRAGATPVALDTGFLVHNERTYPLLVRLFRELGVQTQASDMSFSVGCAACGVEYSGRRPLGSGCTREIVRWLRTAGADADLENVTLAEYVELRGYSRRFRDHFIVPLAAALWSTGTGLALDFPAGYAIRFFRHHGMLGFRRLQWLTVKGGSREYVARIAERVPIRLETPVRSIRRQPGGVELLLDAGATARYDAVVVATHADQALALLAAPSDDERRILGSFRYTENETVLHTDERYLPRRHPASWNYRLEDCRAATAKPTVTYWLNSLQELAGSEQFLVTLNPGALDESKVIRRIPYRHPLYTVESLRAQRELPFLAGQQRTWFAGAYFGNGFHEDGLAAGVRAARGLGAPWD